MMFQPSAHSCSYAQCGVPEYLVYAVSDSTLRWFDLDANLEIPAGADGIVRMSQFPGLWIDQAALAGKDFAKLQSVLQQGLDSREHAEFVRRLNLKKLESHFPPGAGG